MTEPTNQGLPKSDVPGGAAIPDDSLEAGLRVAFGSRGEGRETRPRSVLEVLGKSTRKVPPLSLRDIPGGQGPPVRPPDRRDEGASRMGRYEVAGEIARGGVGSILKARDADLGRDVALKVLLDVHRGNREMTRRFIEEAQIGGQLQHPGIVPVYEMGLVAGDQPFFAMKLVQGKTLAEILEERKTPGEGRQRLLGIFEQVSETMAYAHARGVIHRDLKPSNVMVGPFGEVQVMDWGLAKVLARGGAVEDRRAADPRESARGSGSVETVRSGREGSESRAGSVMGTPSYMAPEQARGEVEALDERSDVFGLGAILCEILTGKPPYTGAAFDEIYRKAKEGAQEETLRRLESSGADRELILLARRCLSPDPRERPRSAGAVAEGMRGYLESLEARARALEVRAARARSRLALAVTVMAALLLAGAGLFWMEKRSREEEARDREASSSALEEARRLRSQAREGSGDLGKWEAALREAERAVALASGIRDEAFRDRARSLRGEIAVEVKDRRLAARLERIREDRGFIFDELGLDLRQRLLSHGFDESLELAFEELDRSYREAFLTYGIDMDGPDPALAAARIRGSGIRTELVLALDQWAALWKLGAEGDRTLWRRILHLAQEADGDPLRNRLRNAEEAGELRALESLAEDPAIAAEAPSTLDSLAFTFRSLGERSRERSVLLIAQRAHPDDFWTNLRLGKVLIEDGRFDDSFRYLEAARALRPRSGYARFLLGSAYQGKGSRRDAFLEFQEDIEIDPESCRSYYRLSEILGGQGTEVLGNDLLELRRALEAVASSGREYHTDGLIRLLAQALFLTGERIRAILTLEESARAPGAGHGSFPYLGSQDLSHAQLLRKYRGLVLPDLVSFASIDRALDLGEVLGTPAGKEGGGVRLDYLEGVLLERAGKHREALEKFSRARVLEKDLPEPVLRLAGCLRRSGDPASAERELREALRQPGMGYASLWNLWLSVSFADLKRTPAEVLAALPEPGEKVSWDGEKRFPKIPTSYESDVRWLLEQLCSGEPIRINCGGGDYKSPGGALWSRDRFYTFGGVKFLYGRSRASSEIELTEDDPLFQTERWFAQDPGRPAGYRIPLPPGTWRVTLGFAEIWYKEPGKRIFDVYIEGRRVLERYDPASSGFARADLKTFEVEVSDGLLEIELARVLENPKISTIEVQRAR